MIAKLADTCISLLASRKGAFILFIIIIRLFRVDGAGDNDMVEWWIDNGEKVKLLLGEIDIYPII